MISVENKGDFVRITEDMCNESTMEKIEWIIREYKWRGIKYDPIIDWEIKGGGKILSRPEWKWVDDALDPPSLEDLRISLDECLPKHSRIKLDVLFMCDASMSSVPTIKDICDSIDELTNESTNLKNIIEYLNRINYSIQELTERI